MTSEITRERFETPWGPAHIRRPIEPGVDYVIGDHHGGYMVTDAWANENRPGAHACRPLRRLLLL